MRNIRLILLTVLLTSPTQQLFAWGKTGHRVVAQVAYMHLTPSARNQVDSLLGPRGLIYQANWADDIKSDTIYTTSHNWHYQDFDSATTDADLLVALIHYPSVGGNLLRSLDSLQALLRLQPRNPDALRFLVHIMGDRFCPMHSGRLTDLGGNRVSLQWFGQPYNLHRIWDEGLIELLHYSYTELAQYLDDTYAPQAQAILQMTDYDILRHNFATATAIYRHLQTWDGNGWNYAYHFTPTLEWQLYAAGLHLAKLLNQIYV